MLGLTFLHPWVLWGLLAGGIPVIIHLLNKRRYRPLPWAAMRFLREAIRVNARRMQIEDWILLALRTLLFLLVPLAFALPVLRSHAVLLGQPQVCAVILLDDSYSMNYTDGDRSRFEQARETARDLIAKLRRGDSVSVILMSEAPRRLFREPTFDLELARNLIGRLECSYAASGAGRALALAQEDMQRARQPSRVLYMISDFQKGLLSGAGVEARLAALREQADLVAIPIGEGYDSNLAVVALEPDAGVVAAGVPTMVHARVRNFGQTVQREYPVELFIDEARRDRRWVDVPAGGEVDVAFLADFREPGQHSIEVRLPADSLPTDNSRYHVIDVREKVPILLVTGEPAARGAVGAAEYVGTALAPGWLLGEAEEDHLLPTRIAPARLGVETLEQYPMIGLIDVPALDPEPLARLETYVRNGGGLLIVPGERVDVRHYNERLFRDGQGLLPARFESPGFHKEQGECFLTPEGYDHPVLSLFADGSLGDLSQIRFQQTMLLEEPSTARVVCKYSTGRPAIVERSFGKGRVVLLGAGLGRTWGNLVWKPSFLVLTRRMTEYLMRRESEGMNLGMRDAVNRFQPGGSAALALAVQHPRGDTAMAELESAVGGVFIRYTGVDAPGVYRLTADQAVVGRFAANVDPAESDLGLPPMGLAGGVMRQVDAARIGAITGPETPGAELWMALLKAVLILLMIEAVFLLWVETREKRPNVHESA